MRSRPFRLIGALLLGLGLAAARTGPVRLAGRAADWRSLIEAPVMRVVHGDFDGDARPDRCEIVGTTRIAVQLSTAATPEQLTLGDDAPRTIVALASIDIDHDGNLDLVASLSDGGIAVWINSGHGAFARAVPRDVPVRLVSATRLSLAGLVALVGVTVRADTLPGRPTELVAALDARDIVRPADAAARPFDRRLTRAGRAPPTTSL